MINIYVDEVENSNESDNEEVDNSHAQDGSDEISPAEFQHDAVSALNLCQTHEATKLVIFNLEYKLQNNDQYDIGGTYNKDNPDLWFFCTTSMGPKVRILNICVCQRNKGTYKISISDIPSTVQLSTLENFPNYLSIDKFKTKIFKSSENDKCHYITSFCFKFDDLENLKNKSVCIPIQIERDPKCPVDSDILKKIKINHFISVIFKQNENTDFILESNTGKKYNVHKIVLAAQSNVIKDIVRNSKSNTSIFDISDDEMEALLEFLYTGKVKSVLDENCFKLIDIAYKFKLEKLIILLKLEIVKNINVKNAVEIAVFTERYNLDNIQKVVFEFIKKNPEVLETEGWTNLNDVALTKKLFKKIYVDNI
ncbi:unnamed protein product [Euphydryas editha]|uniref:BTB domain-containing protein n=1 Tax=Euphydryas editha TaxID=104508 RepID=A0AAU9URA0_EUPED|nr:unnamed protein product [Euphydryas editha]